MKDDILTKQQQSAEGERAGCCCGGSARAAKDTDHQSGAAVQPTAKPEISAKSGGGCCGHG